MGHYLRYTYLRMLVMIIRIFMNGLSGVTNFEINLKQFYFIFIRKINQHKSLFILQTKNAKNLNVF